MIPLISIIIPVYNTEQFLSTCLNSMRDQTFKEIEILCINDGSTDRSGEILAEYAKNDSRFRVFDQVNAGPATARNKGLAEARGKYIMFCDSDDWYESNMCEQMFQSMEEQNVDFVMCNTIVEQFDRVTDIPYKYFFPKKEGRYSFRNNFRFRLNVLLWNKIFRKDLIVHYNVTFPNGMYGREDDVFCQSYFFISKTVCFLDQKLYHYVQRTGSFMDAWTRHFGYKDCLAILQIAGHLYDFLEQGDLLKEKGNLFCQFYIKNGGDALYRLPFQYRREMLERIRNEVLQYRIDTWPLFRPRQLKRALQKGDDRTAIKILSQIPDKYILLVRTGKYALLEWISRGKKRKKYRRKKNKVLYESRYLERFLTAVSKYKEESKK